MLAWSFFDIGLRYFKYEKHKKWLIKAEVFIKSQSGNEIEAREETSSLEDIMALIG